MRYGDIYFNGQHLKDIGGIVTEPPKYPLSSRELSFISAPNKSGDIIVDKKRFKNIPVTYKVAHIPSWDTHTGRQFVFMLSDWLQSVYDYAILRDTDSPGYFRRGVCTGITNVTEPLSGMVEAAISFICDPFLYNDTGTRALVYEHTSAGADTYSIVINNDEKWSSEPVIKLTGRGAFTLTVNDTVIEVTALGDADTDGVIIIDKPRENVYDASGVPCNDKIEGLGLPQLLPGENNITVAAASAGAYTLEITPNWGRL